MNYEHLTSFSAISQYMFMKLSYFIEIPRHQMCVNGEMLDLQCTTISVLLFSGLRDAS